MESSGERNLHAESHIVKKPHRLGLATRAPFQTFALYASCVPFLASGGEGAFPLLPRNKPAHCPNWASYPVTSRCRRVHCSGPWGSRTRRWCTSSVLALRPSSTARWSSCTRLSLSAIHFPRETCCLESLGCETQAPPRQIHWAAAAQSRTRLFLTNTSHPPCAAGCERPHISGVLQPPCQAPPFATQLRINYNKHHSQIVPYDDSYTSKRPVDKRQRFSTVEKEGKTRFHADTTHTVSRPDRRHVFRSCATMDGASRRAALRSTWRAKTLQPAWQPCSFAFRTCSQARSPKLWTLNQAKNRNRNPLVSSQTSPICIVTLQETPFTSFITGPRESQNWTPNPKPQTFDAMSSACVCLDVVTATYRP